MLENWKTDNYIQRIITYCGLSDYFSLQIGPSIIRLIFVCNCHTPYPLLVVVGKFLSRYPQPIPKNHVYFFFLYIQIFRILFSNTVYSD